MILPRRWPPFPRRAISHPTPTPPTFCVSFLATALSVQQQSILTRKSLRQRLIHGVSTPTTKRRRVGFVDLPPDTVYRPRDSFAPDLNTDSPVPLAAAPVWKRCQVCRGDAGSDSTCWNRFLQRVLLGGGSDGGGCQGEGEGAGGEPRDISSVDEYSAIFKSTNYIQTELSQVLIPPQKRVGV